MSVRTLGPLLGLLVFLTTVVGVRPARAQSLMVQAVAAHSSHSLLGSQTVKVLAHSKIPVLVCG